MVRKLNWKSFLVGISLGIVILSFQIRPAIASIFIKPAFPNFIKPTNIPKPTKPPKPCILGRNCNPTITSPPIPTFTPTVTPTLTLTPTLTPSPTLTPTPIISFVNSDTTWKYSDSEILGWTNLNFDDSNWSLVNAPSDGLCPPSAINPEGRIDQNGAMPMWTQNPVSGSTAYFRKTFNLPTVGQGSIRTLFDDDGDIYLNGNLVLSSHNGTVEGIQTAVVSQFLQVGQNIISIRGIDAGGCQSVQFELKLN